MDRSAVDQIGLEAEIYRGAEEGIEMRSAAVLEVTTDRTLARTEAEAPPA